MEMYTDIYEMQSARHCGVSSLLIVILLVISIIGGMVFTGMMATAPIVENVEKNAVITVHLQGDDVMITLLANSFRQKISSIEVSIDGVSGRSMTKPIAIGTPVLCKDIAEGVTGSKFIVINARFADGTSAIIHYTRLQFS
ncbi:hypothetical protein [Methanorbis rubei]|uniref:Uncharacterized protein n=1 Tax=Methanorbis rubei TaxID=3028300 RepID=A0AAE4SBR2_9EURY|nr:hypothetical protein [Methanocorpusculaceae archaeon Cs1]